MRKDYMIKVLIALLIICTIIIVAIIILAKIISHQNINIEGDSPQLTIDNDVYRLSGEKVLLAIEEIAEENIENIDKFFAEDVYYREIEFSVQTQLYIYGTAWKNDYTQQENVYIIITLNDDELLYNFKLKKENITKQEYDEIIEKIKTEKITDEKIEYDENNEFNYSSLTDEDMTRRYMDYYKVLALYNPENAYSILNEEYRQKRFGSIEAYVEYSKLNKNILEMLTMEKYVKKSYTEYTQYIVKDVYENYYIIDVKDLFIISMQLDNYTIENNEYKEKYKKLTDEQKAKVSLTKVIKMINNKDYENLYNLIDERYRTNNFSTMEIFKEYLNQKYFDYNIVNTTNIQLNVNAYICEMELLSDTSSAAESVKNNIIIKLGEETDFRISFPK